MNEKFDNTELMLIDMIYLSIQKYSIEQQIYAQQLLKIYRLTKISIQKNIQK